MYSVHGNRPDSSTTGKMWVATLDNFDCLIGLVLGTTVEYEVPGSIPGSGDLLLDLTVRIFLVEAQSL